ncbi:MAG: hypothetical protein DMD61_09305 [Gemmatimonadetes bacterium]|nr:MAG: hypothetical protein DMD61_09305 [Gemmatimonadota bacterium]
MTRSVLWVLAAVGLAPAPSPRPRLVVVITVDQLRPDYLDRYRPQLQGGLRLLLREGAVFRDAYQDHAVTETAPGHSTILSGRWPAHTGIIANTVGVLDSTAPLIGLAGPILPIGRAKQSVYWYQSGYFTTSRYYGDSLPLWVRAFNARRLPFEEAGAVWNLLLPARDYPEPDSVPYENGGAGFMFPHHLPADSAQAAVALAGIPTMDSLTLAFALEGTRALRLGGRGATDLLAVSLSTTDAIGHAFGPDSREIHDQILRLDRYLGTFLQQLFVRYGTGNVLVVLTADHGVTPYPERSRALGRRDAVRVIPDSLIASANAALDRRAGGRDWLQFDTGMLLLADRPRLAAQGVNVDSVIADLAGQLRGLPGVARVDRPADLAAQDTTDAVVRRWIHQVPPDAGVELVVTLKPYSIWTYPPPNPPIAMHGQPTDADAHVPLILMGPEIRRGTYDRRVSTVDIAPTLARLLGLTPAEPLDGRVLAEALAAGN